MRLHVCFIHQPLWQRAVRTCPLCAACPCKGPAWCPVLPPAVLEETLTVLLSSPPSTPPVPSLPPTPTEEKIKSRRRCLGPPLPVCDRVCTTGTLLALPVSGPRRGQVTPCPPPAVSLAVVPSLRRGLTSCVFLLSATCHLLSGPPLRHRSPS